MKKLLLAMLLATSAGVYAAPPGPIGRAIYSSIESIRIDTDGFATVYFVYPVLPENFVTGACRDAEMDHALAFDSKTDAGKSILAVLLEAKASGRVVAYGTGRCMLINGDTVEMLHFARMQPETLP